MEDSEHYTSLERGLVDGTSDIVATILDFSLYEVLKYIIDHPVGLSSSNIAAMNLDAWNNLPPHLQDLMMKIVLELEPEVVDHFASYGDEVIQELVDKGMEIIYFPEENAKEYVDLFYEASWEALKAKEVLSPEEYLKAREITGN